jgi:hypothetical protein
VGWRRPMQMNHKSSRVRHTKVLVLPKISLNRHLF